jgi:hypothetical protein
MIRTFRSLPWLVAGGLCTTMVIGGIQLATASSPPKIHACQAKSNGALRIAKHCTKHEKALSWNQRGPAGKAGKAGKSGAVFGTGVATTSSVALTGGAGAEHVVASVTIPSSAGGHAFAVTATAYLSSGSASGALGSCQLFQGATAIGNAAGWEMPGTTGIIEAYPTLSTVVTIPAAGVLSYECNSSAVITADDASLSAVQLASTNAED